MKFLRYTLLDYPKSTEREHSIKIKLFFRSDKELEDFLNELREGQE